MFIFCRVYQGHISVATKDLQLSRSTRSKWNVMQVELSTENKNSKEEICPKQQAQDSYIDSCNRMAKWTARNANSRKIPLVFSLYWTPIAGSLNHHVLPPTFSGNREVIKLTSWGVGGLHYTIHHHRVLVFVSWVVIRDLSTLLMAGFNKKKTQRI